MKLRFTKTLAIGLAMGSALATVSHAETSLADFCGKIDAASEKVQLKTTTALAQGTIAVDLASTALSKPGSLTLSEANNFYDKTDKLLKEIKDTVDSLKELDNIIPSDTVKQQLIHLKIGSFAQALIQFYNDDRKTAAMTDATLCYFDHKDDPKENAKCEAQALVPIFIHFDKEGKRSEIYREFAAFVESSQTDLQTLLKKEFAKPCEDKAKATEPNR